MIKVGPSRGGFLGEYNFLAYPDSDERLIMRIERIRKVKLNSTTLPKKYRIIVLQELASHQLISADIFFY